MQGSSALEERCRDGSEGSVVVVHLGHGIFSAAAVIALSAVSESTMRGRTRRIRATASTALVALPESISHVATAAALRE